MSEALEEIGMEEADTQHGRFLTFSLGEEVFGLEIRCVTEIVGMQKINGIPESPPYVKGIINLRGKIIPVIDMRLRLKKEPIAYTDRTCIVVVDIRTLTVGLVVDRVDEVISIPDESIVPPPGFRAGFQNRYIRGIGKVDGEVRLLLDCERLFRDEEIETFGQLAQDGENMPENG